MPSLKSIGKKAKKAAGFTLDNLLNGESFLNAISRVNPLPDSVTSLGIKDKSKKGQVGTDRMNTLRGIPLVGGFAADAYNTATSPLSIGTAAVGPAVAGGLKTLGPAGRVAAGFVAPVLEGGNFVSRLGAEAGLTAGSLLAGRTAEKVAPEPVKPYANIAGSLVGGAVGLRSLNNVRAAKIAAQAPTPGIGGAAVDRLTELLKQSKRVEKDQATLYRKARGPRAGAFRKEFEAGGYNPTSFENARRTLAGDLPSAQFTFPDNQNVDPADVNSLLERIWKYYPENRTYAAQDTMDAFQRLVFDKKLPTKSEIRELERVFGSKFTSALLGNRSAGAILHENIIDIINLPRALMASLDISAPFNQGAMAITRKEWWGAWGPMMKAFASEKGAQDAAEAITKRKHYDRGVSAKLYEASLGRSGNREEAFASRFARLIPGVARSERAYVTFLNKLRWDLWENNLTKFERAGMTLTKEDERKLANVYNVLTGRGNMPGEEVADTLNAFLFSPRRLTSIIERMAYAPVALGGSALETVAGRQVLPGSAIARKEAARDLVGFFGMGTAALTLMNVAGIADVEVDPRSPDFGKGRIGNMRYDPWGGFQQVARYATQMAVGQRKDSGGEIVKASRGEVFGRFAESKLGPVQGAVVDIWRGRTMMGDSVDISKSDDLNEQLANRLVPLFLQNLDEAIAEEGAKGFLMALPGGTGIGVQTYETVVDVRERVLQDAAQGNPAYEGMRWQDLTPGQQQDLEEKYKPDFDKVRVQSDYEDERMNIEETTRARQRKLATALSDKNNPITPDMFRRGMDDLQQTRRTQLDQARKDFGVTFKDDPTDVVNQWYKLREQATEAYGIVDPQQLDAVQEDFYNRLDDEGRKKIDDLREYRPDPTVQWYFDDKKTIAKAGYWTAQEVAFKKLRGKIPANIETVYDLMEAVQAARNNNNPRQAARLEALLNAVNATTRAKRLLLRKQNKNLDEALVRIYSVQPMHRR